MFVNTVQKQVVIQMLIFLGDSYAATIPPSFSSKDTGDWRSLIQFRLTAVEPSALCVLKSSRCVCSTPSHWLLLHWSDLWTCDQALLRPLLTFFKLRRVVCGAVEERPCKSWQIRVVTFAKTKVGAFSSSCDDESPQHLRTGDLPRHSSGGARVGSRQGVSGRFSNGFLF